MAIEVMLVKGPVSFRQETRAWPDNQASSEAGLVSHDHRHFGGPMQVKRLGGQ
jgi:hypothetical protein